MKIISLLLLLCFFQTVNATTYYFSTNSGDDSRRPDEAQNPSTPWKTLRKLNYFFNSLKPGDALLLKRGETFYGSIDVSKSGTAGAPIVIGEYGAGDKPVITSLVTLTNWVFKGNGIWESYNPALGSNVKMVLLNGEEQQLGRFPNSDAGNKGYLTYESHAGTSSITDANFSHNKNWKGAEVVIRSRRWILDRNIVISNTSKKIFYKNASKYSPYDKQGYFIQNDIKTLDKFGEWYFNPSAQKLSVYFGSRNPSSYSIQSPALANIIYARKFSNIIFKNLNIKGANGTSVSIKFGSNITIQNCDIEFSGLNGVEAKYHTNFKMENCTVSNSNNNGIDLGYGGNYATIRNNKITNTSVFAGMGGSGDGHGIGIQSNGNGSIIEYNAIRQTGYIGIFFNGNNVTIKNNFLDNFCLIKDDGAGIYSHTGSSARYTQRKVIGNIIINGQGAPEGTSNTAYSPAEGIYMDNDASNVEIKDNTIANCNNNGIYIHNAYGMAIRNNTVFNNARQLNVIENADHSRIRKCEFTDNIFFSKLSSQYISYITGSANDVNLFGKFNNNYYARPLNDKLGIFSSYVNKHGKQIGEKFDLQGWKDKYGQDKASKKAPKEIAPYRVNKLTGANKISNGNFSKSLDGLHNSSCKKSWKNSGILDGGYVKIDPRGNGSSVFIGVGELKAGKHYILKYSLKGSDDNSMSIGTFLRQYNSPYKKLASLQSRGVSTKRSENEIMFSSATNNTSASVVFVADNKSTYYLDNVEFYEADVEVTKADDAIRFEYNATKQDKRISLNDNYIDVTGKKLSNSITLQPYTSIVLMKDDDKDNTPSKNVAPKVSITSPKSERNFSGPATITMSANATDEDGSISKVEFYIGKKLLATEYVSPYTFPWKNVPEGNYEITAKASDDKGLETTSDKVRISVQTNKAPVVNITKPNDNQKFKAPATIRLVAEAKDIDGEISKVEFYNGSTLLRTEYKYPYTYWWTNVKAGRYTIIAIATDNEGLRTKSKSIQILVAGKAQNRPTDSVSSLIVAKPIDDNAPSLKLSPNPANDFLHIVTAGLPDNSNMQVAVLSLSGVLIKTVQSNTSNRNIVLDVSSLGSGSYMIRIVCEDKIVIKQFIKL